MVEKNIIASADGLIYASNPLREFLMSKYKFLRNKPEAVIHCAVDASEFMFDPSARQRLRKEWGWEDKTIIIHSEINAPWVDLNGIIHLIKECERAIPEARFLFLAGEPGSWRDVHTALSDKTKIKVISAEPGEMAAYLAGADIGLVARINSPVNEVASPTKMAEYLAVGLPVLLTRGIGDYAGWIKENNFGEIVDALTDLNGCYMTQILKKLCSIDRSNISCWARDKLDIYNYTGDLKRVLADVAFMND